MFFTIYFPLLFRGRAEEKKRQEPLYCMSAIWDVFFEIFCVARARRASAICKIEREIYTILQEQPCYNDFIA